ncbi:hypothetical protein Q31b_29260 [Novipirellula aureliae]|uniref:DUF1571 domain-containing protein n=1 Tax=Novipirellula aureliae TaxID=2527966 RepID=A0A5C6E0J0_9BACT|nr:DUF1571 domain-containing protein [Novipirellula aureliae]TWU41477.1 hypothetical protein Q31b_29260 [Novipirellula aureliae]
MNQFGQHLLSGLATIFCMFGLIANAPADEIASKEPTTDTHPLLEPLRYANLHCDYIEKNIRDYSCYIFKRERMNGELQKAQCIQVQMRCAPSDGGRTDRPMAVFLNYLAPSSLRGRKVLYVEGKNNGMMLVRKGGLSFNYVKLEIDPHGSAAKRESNYPITDLGFDKMIQRLIELVTNDMENDPDATNTKVSYFRKAKVKDRVCTHIQVVHPNRVDGVEFHKASLFFDDTLHVPIRITVHDWPEREGMEPPLIEEYTYVNLQLNVGLTDADFSKTKLDSPE